MHYFLEQILTTILMFIFVVDNANLIANVETSQGSGISETTTLDYSTEHIVSVHCAEEQRRPNFASASHHNC